MNEAVVHTMEYYSAIKRSIFESVLVRWMNLEPVMQKEVNQKEGNKNHIYVNIYIYIYGLSKNDTDEPICRAGMETQT